MRKFTTVLAAMLLALSMMAMPAMADETKTLEQLEQELAEAEAAVERLDGEVSDLKAEIVTKQGEIDVQQGVVDGLKDDLEDAEKDLGDAIIERNRLQALYDACTNNGCRNQLDHHVQGGPLADAREDVTEKQGVVDGINEDIEDAKEILGDLKDDLTDLKTDLETTEQELADARQAVIDLERAIAEFEKAPAHPGCTGINNAKANVAKNVTVKSKAPAALDAVSQKLGC